MNLGELYKTKDFMKLEVEAVVDTIPAPRTVNLKSGGRAQVADVMIKDESNNKFKLVLWDSQIKMVRAGSKIRVENGYITVFKGRRSLNVGKYGKLSVLEF